MSENIRELAEKINQLPTPKGIGRVIIVKYKKTAKSLLKIVERSGPIKKKEIKQLTEAENIVKALEEVDKTLPKQDIPDGAIPVKDVFQIMLQAAKDSIKNRELKHSGKE